MALYFAILDQPSTKKIVLTQEPQSVIPTNAFDLTDLLSDTEKK